MNKILKKFIDWLEDGNRENWDIEEYLKIVLDEQQEDLKSIIRFLEGDCPREKIINYIKKYLVK